MKNQLLKSGRIAVPHTDNIGRFVPPKKPDFLTNVEAGVVRLVMACLSKGLMTVSSCEGHPEDGDNREVTLAFKSPQSLEKFKDIIPDFRTTETRRFFNDENDQRKALTSAFGTVYDRFITVWVDPPDVEEKTRDLEHRIIELYDPY
jgi:hypothetical protein